MRRSLSAVVFSFASAVHTSSIAAQAPTPAPMDAVSLYRALSPGVFLLEARDSIGTVIDFGSAFLLSPQRLVTNAHVVNKGQFFLRTVTGAVPITIERVDVYNDLALLRSATPVDGPALELAETSPPPGTSIWTLGSPKGLERTISDGIVSGVRVRAGRRLLQISAPISQGSSGGPVVGRDGRVVGVTVGFLPGAQSITFAVPSEFVVKLLGSSATVTSEVAASTEARQDGGEPGGNVSYFPNALGAPRFGASCDADQLESAAVELDLALLALRSSLRGYVGGDPIDTARVASTHRALAAILVRRGVYDQAEYHARQARALAPVSTSALHELSRALLCQGKATEAAAVAEEAIRLTDGKSGGFHFDAGSAYFELKEFAQCARAFELASNLNPKDDAAPYHAGVCHARQGSYADAARWLEAALVRNPDRSDRADIEDTIRRWRR